ncbi:hypothetical protein DH17_12060 [Acinetobacter oleivorans]|uniref:Uncharacterized protein n=1 Tax=Acinetobacter oleivorans TaxID=1148157 RepID=A0A0B2UEN5_9GAMM|nr:hypothetical protein DH17_12060 [Acinetobacter oleivorans]
MLDKVLDSKQKKTPNLSSNKNCLIIGLKSLHKSYLNNLLAVTAQSTSQEINRYNPAQHLTDILF